LGKNLVDDNDARLAGCEGGDGVREDEAAGAVGPVVEDVGEEVDRCA